MKCFMCVVCVVHRANVHVVILALLFALSFFKPLHAQTMPQLRILSVESATYPELALTFSFVGPTSVSTAPLTPADLSVSINGSPPLSSTLALTQVTQPLRIAVVAETSAAMGDVSSPPDRTRLREMTVQLQELVRLMPPDTAFSLTTFDTDARVAFPLQPDGGGFLNTLDQFVLRPTAAESAIEPAGGDALMTALRLGLASLALPADDPRAAAPAALLLFAAGTPGETYDAAAVAAELSALEGVSPFITIVGLGGDQEGQFREQPGAPDALQSLAAALGGLYLPLYTADSAQVAPLSEALRERYTMLLDQRMAYRVSTTAPPLAAGEHTLRLGVSGLSQEVSFFITAAPTRLDLHLAAPQLTQTTQFSVTVTGAQAPVARVEYILNNVLLGESQAGPDFAFTFDRSLEPWRSAFPPGTYELFAAATAADGQVYRSAVALVEVLPPSSPNTILLGNPLLWGGVALATVLSAGGLWYWRRPRRQGAPRSMTRRYAAEGGLRGPTRRRKQGLETAVLRIAIVEGDTARTLTLTTRECMIGRDPHADIPLSNEEVSWNHAVLSMVQGGAIQLADLRSTNGTFVGIERTRVSDSSPTMLRSGATFWIGPVRLVVEEVT